MNAVMLHTHAIEEAKRIYRRAGLDVATLPEIRIRDVKAGRYLHDTDCITLPLWLGDRLNDSRAPRYFEWYVAHELAHGLAGKAALHGLVFQMVLRDLAPEAWHWESTYKPRNYAQALEAFR